MLIGKSWKVGSSECPDFPGKYYELIGEVKIELFVEDYPTASFTATELPNEPGAFTLTSTSTDPLDRPLVSRWTLGDGTTSFADRLIHRYDKPGAYPVKLEVENTEGLTDTETQAIHVNAPTLTTSILWDEDVEVGGRLRSASRSRSPYGSGRATTESARCAT